MLEDWTDRARLAHKKAREEADKLGHQYVGTEHLLLGILNGRGGIGEVVLLDLGITHEVVEEKIRVLLG